MCVSVLLMLKGSVNRKILAQALLCAGGRYQAAR